MTLLSASDLAAIRSTLHEVSNATLLAVRGPGARDRHGEQTADGTSLWSGTAPAFLEREQTAEIDAPEAMRPARARHADRMTLTILEEDASSALSGLLRPPWGDTRVEVSDARVSPAVDATFKVVDLVQNAWGTLDSVTLILVPEPTVA